MIKFRCGHCNQKLGVPDEWAGKRIRCNRCHEPCPVPSLIELQPAVKPVEPAEIPEAPEAAGPEGGFDAGGFGGDLSDLGAGQAIQVEPRHAPILPKTRAPIPEYRISRGEEAEPSRTMAVAKGVGKIPLSIGLAFAGAIVVGMAWGGLAAVSGYHLNFMAVFVAMAAAAGIGALHEDRNVMIGLLAAFIGLAGIFCGKYFVAKWAVMPYINSFVDKQLEEVKTQTYTAEQRNELLKDPDVVYNCVCMQLAENGEFSRETAMEAVMIHIRGEEPVEALEGETTEPTEAMSAQIQEAQDKVEAAVAEWNDAQKRDAIRMQYGPLQQTLMEKIVSSKVGTTATLAVAYVASFSLFDLLWIPMALWTAFKIGNGSQ